MRRRPSIHLLRHIESIIIELIIESLDQICMSQMKIEIYLLVFVAKIAINILNIVADLLIFMKGFLTTRRQ